jgi:GNAT superfamily N-acetyltransferase
MTTVIIEQEPACGMSGAVVLAAMGPGEDDIVAAMFRRCSTGTLRHRFHGFTDGMTYLNRQLRTSDAVVLANCGESCVGLGVLAGGSGGTWDIGVLVEDAWQRRGIGTRLVAALAEEAKRRHVATIRADVLAEDSFIVGMLRRIGPVTVRLGRGTMTVDVQLTDAAPENPAR